MLAASAYLMLVGRIHHAGLSKAPATFRGLMFEKVVVKSFGALNLPEPVSLKRFFAPEFVFIFGMATTNLPYLLNPPPEFFPANLLGSTSSLRLIFRIPFRYLFGSYLQIRRKKEETKSSLPS